MIKSPIKIAVLFIFCAFLAACASGPPEKKAEIIELAYKSLGSGVKEYKDSNYQLAELHFNKSLAIFRSIDNREGIASSCLNLAKVQLAIKDLSTAQHYLTIAEKTITESSLDKLNDHLAITKSSLALSTNNYEEARQLLSPLTTKKQDNPFYLAALQNSIRIAIAENKMKSAQQLTTTFSNEISKQTKIDSTYQARLYRFQAELNTDTDSTDKYKQALQIYRKHTHRPGIASTLYEWGNKLLSQNKTEAAKEKLLRALYIRQSIKDITGSLNILTSLNKTYTELKVEEMAQKTNIWTKELQADNFNQWGKFTEAFDTYPSLK